MNTNVFPPCSARIIVGMSGGVDSSVTALLLKERGYVVEGLFMKNWEEDDGTEYCTAKEDLEDARKVADQIGIPLHTANFADEYWDNVFEYFLSEYKAGRTPNPDILCNREIKFRAFLDYAIDLGASGIATGHYARKQDILVENRQEAILLKGCDLDKDQSYFLYALGCDQLAQAFFPLGEMRKSEVRAIAEKHNLATKSKKDSTGICFIGERRFSEFLKRYLPAQPGHIETTEGKIIGQHQGLMYHTIGQRQGLGIGGVKNTDDAPWYVIEKDIARNVLVVGQGGDHPGLFSRKLIAGTVHWISGRPPEAGVAISAKIRYRQQDESCDIRITDNGSYLVTFERSQRAVTPGQSVVFYEKDRCLGGGIIECGLTDSALF